jgi:hypothetical protein
MPGGAPRLSVTVDLLFIRNRLVVPGYDSISHRIEQELLKRGYGGQPGC